MASISANGSRGNHQFILTVTDTTASGKFKDSVTHKLSYTFQLKPIQTKWDWNITTNPVSWRITIGNETLTGTIVSYDGLSTVTLKSGTIDYVQTEHGAPSINLSLSVTDNTGQSYTPGNASASGTMTLNSQTKQYTISFNANGGTGAPSAQTKDHNVNMNITTIKPTRTFYTFRGWALSKAEADAGTVYYTPGAECGRNQDLELYAVWSQNVLTINYYTNNKNVTVGTYTGVTPGLYPTSTKILSADFPYTGNYSTGLHNIPLTCTGYTHTKYWVRVVNSSTHYRVERDEPFTDGQAIAQKFGVSLANSSQSIDVLAEWSTNTYNQTNKFLKYDPYNGNWTEFTSKTTPAEYGTTFVSNNDGIDTPYGFEFVGFLNGGTWTVTGDYDGSLGYGHYKPVNCSVTYHDNGGEGSPAAHNYYMNGVGLSGTAYLSSTVPTREGYNFTGWLCEETNVLLSPGQAIPDFYRQFNLYAQWSANEAKIAYNVNGGSISSDGYTVSGAGFIMEGDTAFFQTISYNTSEDPYDATTFGLKRSGYKFIGWRVRSTGEFLYQDVEYESTKYAQYSDATKTTENTETVHCYLDAQWELLGLMHINQDGTYEKGLTWVNKDGTWYRGIPWVNKDGTWYMGGK